MIWQYIIIGILLAGSAYFLYRTSKKKLKDPCADCTNCPSAGSCSAIKIDTLEINKKQ